MYNYILVLFVLRILGSYIKIIVEYTNSSPSSYNFSSKPIIILEKKKRKRKFKHIANVNISPFVRLFPPRRDRERQKKRGRGWRKERERGNIRRILGWYRGGGGNTPIEAPFEEATTPSNQQGGKKIRRWKTLNGNQPSAHKEPTFLAGGGGGEEKLFDGWERNARKDGKRPLVHCWGVKKG